MFTTTLMKICNDISANNIPYKIITPIFFIYFFRCIDFIFSLINLSNIQVILATTYSPMHIGTVPSAHIVLTSLFGMGRGGTLSL